MSDTSREDWARAEVDRLAREELREPSALRSAEEVLERLRRIRAAEPLRDTRGFSVERLRKLEDFELRTNPEGFLRRHAGEKLDSSTERRLREALRELARRRDRAPRG